jgi:hypothetical protein
VPFLPPWPLPVARLDGWEEPVPEPAPVGTTTGTKLELTSSVLEENEDDEELDEDSETESRLVETELDNSEDNVEDELNPLKVALSRRELDKIDERITLRCQYREGKSGGY